MPRHIMRQIHAQVTGNTKLHGAQPFPKPVLRRTDFHVPKNWIFQSWKKACQSLHNFKYVDNTDLTNVIEIKGRLTIRTLLGNWRTTETKCKLAFGANETFDNNKKEWWSSNNFKIAQITLPLTLAHILSAFTCSKSTIETSGQWVKSVQS